MSYKLRITNYDKTARKSPLVATHMVFPQVGKYAQKPLYI